MADTMTYQNIVLSSWDTLCVCVYIYMCVCACVRARARARSTVDLYI
jgi:hypothetical protein